MSQFTQAIRSTLALWILTAFLYPLFMLLCGQIAFPFHANGSLITNNQGAVIGSALIGQPFASDRYFWSRPSTIDYSTRKAVATTGESGASNLAPSNPALRERIQGEVTRLQQANIQPTADLVYTSGSGLDPHISLESAQAQISRIANVRNLNTQQIQTLISQNIEGRFLGIFGEPGVNVLKLNLALDAL
ncbi:K(+)-transporting ATPase subunit C [Nostocales cyanobacterium LEGE 11386]|nr:K(+)-transporting ATPase subunit C [Nostocales cyanobacterium LEGE 11386]